MKRDTRIQGHLPSQGWENRRLDECDRSQALWSPSLQLLTSGPTDPTPASTNAGADRTPGTAILILRSAPERQSF